MTDLEGFRAVAQEINAGCRVPIEAGDWWGEMLSSIVLAVGPGDASAVKYVTADYSDDRYEIAVVTDDFLICGEVDEPSKPDPNFSVRVFPLQAITSVDLKAEASYFKPGFRSDWPGRCSVGFEHPQAGSFSFPFSTESRNYENEQLVALVPTLLGIVRNHQ